MNRTPPTRWHRETAVRLQRVKRQWVSRWRERRFRGVKESVSVHREGTGVRIAATSVSAIHAHLPPRLGECERLGVEVAVWRAPWPGWSGRPGHCGALSEFRLSLPPKGKGRAVVEIELSRPVPVEEALRVVLPTVDPWRPIPAPLSDDAEHGTQTIVVDPRGANPCGLSSYAGKSGENTLTLVDRSGVIRWLVRGARAITVAGEAGRPMDARQRALLRAAGAVTLSGVPAAIPAAALAAVLAQLAMTGLVINAPGIDPAVPLEPELADLLRSPFPARADVLAWEARSVAQRRAAMRGHAAWPAGPPSVSALLVSRRPAYAVEAVKALRAQTYPNLEIALGFHGCAAPPGLGDDLRVAEFPAQMPFGAVLGAVTAMASGTLLTKVDDDDLYGPQHIWDLVLARRYSGATVAGKAAEFVFIDGHGVTVRRHIISEAYTGAVAGGAMLIARGDLESVGGWKPVPRSVDRALLDRVLRDGGLVYSTHALGFIYVRHDAGHTWDPGVEHFLLDPRQRWEGLPPHWDA